MVVTWAEEHDELIANLRDPDKLRKAGIKAVREARTKRAAEPDPLEIPFHSVTLTTSLKKVF